MKTLILAFKNPYQSNLMQKTALNGGKLVIGVKDEERHHVTKSGNVDTESKNGYINELTQTKEGVDGGRGVHLGCLDLK